MAQPRVFISSTCYDLEEIREQIDFFLTEYQFETILSEKGDVFFDYSIHTHDSCLREVTNCDYFILIIGGRFGGKYIQDPSKSIVNAEYETALSNNIPIITFIKQSVYNEHLTYVHNKDKNIHYHSIDKQEYASNIFEFINSVRLRLTNNQIHPFSTGNQIKNILKKQFASMIYTYPKNNNPSLRENTLLEIIQDIRNHSNITKDIVELLYLNKDNDLDKEGRLINISANQDLYNFFLKIKLIFSLSQFENPTYYRLQNNIEDKFKWFEFLALSPEFEIISISSPYSNRIINTKFNSIIHKKTMIHFVLDPTSQDFKSLDTLFNSIKQLDYQYFNHLIVSEFNL